MIVGPYVISLFVVVIYIGSKKLERLSTTSLFSLMFEGKADAYLSEAPFMCSTLG
jgi:hypothetical protein